jgi:DNA-directed RNA polymerase subunit RPC12/RpoP
MDYDDEDDKKGPYWRCEECGHEDTNKPMPLDRDKFYTALHKKGAPKCPKCRSEAFVPVGF